MNLRTATACIVALVLAAALVLWREQLFTVQEPGSAPRPLMALATSRPPAGRLDVVLPVVPTGMRRLAASEGALLVHYWAPWERHSRSQAAAIDSLAVSIGPGDLRVMLVCFDPFPSVARYVARQRLRLPVLLDGRHELRRALPCPSIPYTYIVDRNGHVVVAQAGEVDWLSPETRRTLERLEDPDSSPPAEVTPA